MLKLIYTILYLAYITVFFAIIIFFELGDIHSFFDRSIVSIFLWLAFFIFFGLTFVTTVLDLIIGGRPIGWWPRQTDFYSMENSVALLSLILILGIVLFFFGNDFNDFMLVTFGEG